MMVTVLYTILAVVGILVLLFGFVLFSPLWARIVCRDEVEVYLGFSFFKFKVYPKKTKEKKKPKRKEKVKSKASHAHEILATEDKKTFDGESNQKEKKQKKPLKDTLSLIFDIIKSFFEMMGKKSKIEINSLKVTVSKPDAADTAVQFGICNGIVASIVGFAGGFGKTKIKYDEVYVTPDFLSGKSKIETDIKLSVPLKSLLWSLVRGYLRNQFK